MTPTLRLMGPIGLIYLYVTIVILYAEFPLILLKNEDD